MAAQVLPFAARRPRPGTGRFQPGDRVVGIVDGQEREGTVHDTGTEIAADIWIGSPGGPQRHLVAVTWDNPQVVDTATLRHA